MESPVGVKGRKWQAADDSVIFKKEQKIMARGKTMCNVLASISIMFLIACNASSQTIPSSEKDSCNNDASAIFHPCEKDKIVVPYRPDYVEDVDEDKVYDVVDDMPKFPGGPKAMFDYLAYNVQYPKEMGEVCAQGRVIVSFVVEKDGSLTDFKVLKGVYPALDKEALRVVRSMPKWIPGSQNGVRLRVKYVVPVTFRL